MPRIKMTRSSRIILYVLRFYLVFLIGLIIVKFVKTVW
jgi:hypothetical protein